MLSNANGRGCSIREYAARIAALPMRINERNKEVDRSEHHLMVTIEVFKRVADHMTDIGELIISPMIAKALEHYKKSDTTTNPGISSVSASKESRMMMRMYAQYCLENKSLSLRKSGDPLISSVSGQNQQRTQQQQQQQQQQCTQQQQRRHPTICSN
ncbi:uncharacterized protein LOC135107352 [Scylla paramamosain]|uniref:uncharacterized protein LOC135107352 n=1 Tax=Scylla paramamosain TaxID=85552 RepID=UPI0030836AD2